MNLFRRRRRVGKIEPSSPWPPPPGKPLVLRKGEIYVLECPVRLSAEDVKRLQLEWERVAGVPPIVLCGGLRVARTDPGPKPTEPPNVQFKGTDVPRRPK